MQQREALGEVDGEQGRGGNNDAGRRQRGERRSQRCCILFLAADLCRKMLRALQPSYCAPCIDLLRSPCGCAPPVMPTSCLTCASSRPCPTPSSVPPGILPPPAIKETEEGERRRRGQVEGVRSSPWNGRTGPLLPCSPLPLAEEAALGPLPFVLLRSCATKRIGGGRGTRCEHVDVKERWRRTERRVMTARREVGGGPVWRLPGGSLRPTNS